MKKNIHIIGSGFSSIAAACYLAQQGCQVTILEKNDGIGGRASVYKKDGFTFDMGPTWYWMPDIFERFFADFGKQPSDYYHLERLAPAYQVYFDKMDSLLVSDQLEAIYDMFEQEEPGSAKHLRSFLKTAQGNYDVALSALVYQPGISPFELVNWDTITRLNQVLTTIKDEVRAKIVSLKLIKILEFPVLFLGAKPSKTPGLYSFMNWADFGLGTWHPKGGMYEVVKGMADLADSLGVVFKTNIEVQKINVGSDRSVSSLSTNQGVFEVDILLSGADYHHTESLLDVGFRQYSESYWNKRTFAPSSLLFYIGLDKKLEHVSHHTLFFDTDFDRHAYAIYDEPAWPEKPLFYASFPSITDEGFAPSGKEAATILIPLAPGLEDTEEMRTFYFEEIMNRLETLTGQEVRSQVLFAESFCVNDFKDRYHSYKGNAYGLANTLTQTAFLRPKIKSKKVKNLFFTGQLTVPGPGVPPALISGKIAANQILKQLAHEKYF
ncbi:phytoene desaturase family protein [Membranihabitans marinus]|uniref:phytoene desaturase family protein n=1 Tax=Membranihabitans marinus TaxID=1227546 RepID=UPI001F01CA16|nr:phytoene desaturase family protein [Membranihabitans marinus]